MNQYVSKELLDWRVKKIAVENQIGKCNDGIAALQYFRGRLHKELDALMREKPKR